MSSFITCTGPELLRLKIVDNDVFKEIFSWEKSGRGGLLVCGLHMSSLTWSTRPLPLMGLKTIGLSFATGN